MSRCVPNREVNPIQNNKFYFSKPKKFADDNIKFDENGRKFYKTVENTEGKGQIARFEQFLLFSQCFQKTYKKGLKIYIVLSNKLLVVWYLTPFSTLFQLNRGS